MKKLLLILVSLSLITGCGGGGGESGSSADSGCSALRSALRIEGGEVCEINDSPVVRLVFQTARGVSNCSGTLISATSILTAAHCVAEASDIVVISSSGYTERSQQWFWYGPWQTTGASADDAAIVKVSPDFIPNTQINPIPIGIGFDIPVGDEATAVGYGNTSMEADILVGLFPKATTSTVVDKNRGVYLTSNVAEDNGVICPGDSGGPLLYDASKVNPNFNGNVIAGIASKAVQTPDGGCISDNGLGEYGRVLTPAVISLIEQVAPDTFFIRAPDAVCRPSGLCS